MPRSGPSLADAGLLNAAAHRGCRVSYTQLERWRALALVPRNIRRGAGRGRGSVSVTPDDALEKLLEVAADARQGSKLVMGDPLMRAITFRPFRPGSVKDAVTAVWDGACDGLGADLDLRVGPDVAGDARFDAATRATARGNPTAMREVAEWVATGVERPDRPPPRRAMRDMLQSLSSGGRDVAPDDLATAAAALGRTRDSGDEDLNQIWARLEARNALPDWMASELDAAERAAGEAADLTAAEFVAGLEEALETWSLPAMRDRVNAIDEGDLVAAVRAVAKVSAFQGLIVLFGILRVGGDPNSVPKELSHWASLHAAEAMANDQMYKAWTYSWPPVQPSRGGLAFLGYAAGLAAIMGMTEELEAYADRLVAALYPGGRPALVTNLLEIKNSTQTSPQSAGADPAASHDGDTTSAGP